MGLIPFALLISLNSIILMYLNKYVVLPTQPHSEIQLGSVTSAESGESVALHHDEHETRHGPSNFGENRKNEMTVARISVLTVAIFIVCHSIRWIPNIYELIQHTMHSMGNMEWPAWIESMTHLSHFMTTLNSSINFYVYFLSRL